jgi:hypothetical protein
MFTNSEDREASLSLMGCREALLWMNEFVAGLLGGKPPGDQFSTESLPSLDLVTRSEHIIFKTKNDKRRIRCYSLSTSQADIDQDNGGITHEMWKLTLRSGEEFAVDISCAQYGYSEPVMEWNEYANLRIFSRRFGSGAPTRNALNILDVDEYSLEKVFFFLNKMGQGKDRKRAQAMDTLEAMNIIMLEWQTDEKMSIRALLKLPEKGFQRRKADMVNYLDWKLDNPKKIYFTVNGRKLKQERPEKWIHSQ